MTWDPLKSLVFFLVQLMNNIQRFFNAMSCQLSQLTVDVGAVSSCESWCLHWDISLSGGAALCSRQTWPGCWTPVMRNFQVFSPGELQFFCLLPEDLKHARPGQATTQQTWRSLTATSVNKISNWWRQQFSTLFLCLGMTDRLFLTSYIKRNCLKLDIKYLVNL